MSEKAISGQLCLACDEITVQQGTFTNAEEFAALRPLVCAYCGASFDQVAE